MSILAKKFFGDEAAACRKLESVIWPDGPICTHCGSVDQAGRLEGVRTKPSRKNPEGVERHGLWKCYRCRQQFTSLSATALRGSHVPVHKLLQLVFLLTASVKPPNMLKISKVLEIDYVTAWDLIPALRGYLASSSAVEQRTVNAPVAGSIPASSATPGEQTT